MDRKTSARRGRGGGALEDVGIDVLAEPDHARTGDAAAGGAGRRQRRERRVAVLPGRRRRSRRRSAAPRSNRGSGSMLLVPARSCRPSTFCVISVKPGRSLQRASTSCAAFGRASAIAVRRQSYHSHTSCGFMANASGVARSSARNCRHRPSSPRKVGMPLADDTPAPVKTTMAPSARRREISSSVSTGIRGARSIGPAGTLQSVDARFYPRASPGGGRSRLYRGGAASPAAFTATLQAEPDNRYFRHAIAVVVNGEKVGYVAPEVARSYVRVGPCGDPAGDVSRPACPPQRSRDVRRGVAAGFHECRSRVTTDSAGAPEVDHARERVLVLVFFLTRGGAVR